MLHRRFAALAEADVVVDLEGHQHARVIERDVFDLARGEPTHPHIGARQQTTGLCEVRRILLAHRQARQLVVINRAESHSDGQSEADGTDDEWVALLKGLHRGVHLPVSWPANFTYTG
jgi:hypothetical protein